MYMFHWYLHFKIMIQLSPLWPLKSISMHFAMTINLVRLSCVKEDTCIFESLMQSFEHDYPTHFCHWSYHIAHFNIAKKNIKQLIYIISALNCWMSEIYELRITGVHLFCFATVTTCSYAFVVWLLMLCLYCYRRLPVQHTV